MEWTAALITAGVLYIVFSGVGAAPIAQLSSLFQSLRVANHNGSVLLQESNLKEGHTPITESEIEEDPDQIRRKMQQEKDIATAISRIKLGYELNSMIDRSKWDVDEQTFNHMSAKDQVLALLKWVMSPTYICNTAEVLGGIPNGDGQWTVCFDNWISPCRVFSFGIDYDFSFDKDIASRGNCTVDSFDPSMQLPDHKVDENVFYHNLGISASDADDLTGVRMRDQVVQKWKVKTLKIIMQQLAVQELSVLKMDVEGFEWEVLPEILASGVMAHVDQFVFEVHFFSRLYNGKKTVQTWYKHLKALQEAGFVMFRSHENPMSERVSMGKLSENWQHNVTQATQLGANNCRKTDTRHAHSLSKNDLTIVHEPARMVATQFATYHGSPTCQKSTIISAVPTVQERR
eukprot:CFRG6414T1